MAFTNFRKGFGNFRQTQKATPPAVSNLEETSTFGAPTHHNKTLLQGFEWYCPSDGQHWHRLAKSLERLTKLGFDCIWLPPASKAGWEGSNGYDVYDLYDLGEFDQKGSRRTKWGDKEALVKLAKLAQQLGIGLYFDAVLNHKCAADYTEHCQATIVSKEDRQKQVGSEHEIEVWTGYTFSGRRDKYSSFKYQWHHFNGTDWEAKLQSNDNIYCFTGPGKQGWAKDVDDSLGNYDYLMGNDLDLSNNEVKQDLDQWGEWVVKELGLSGFRLDAVKHMSQSFLKEWIDRLDLRFDSRLFFVGEYWRPDLQVLGPVLEKFNGRLHLFDVAFAGNMSSISHNAPAADLRTVFDGTLTKHYPEQAVTFVLNHDTQHRFERDHPVVPIASWFIPLGYALILLRDSPSYPCVFYGDLYGTQSPNPTEAPHLAQPPSCYGTLPRMMQARKLWAYGPERDYFDTASCVGFTRLGDDQSTGTAQATGLAVILNIGNSWAQKTMFVGKDKSGRAWRDLLGFAWGEVTIDEHGNGTFPVGPRHAGIWVDNEVLEKSGVEDSSFVTDIYD